MKKIILTLTSVSIAILLNACGGGGGGGGGGSSSSDKNTPPSGLVKESSISNTSAINPPSLSGTKENIPTSKISN